MTTTRMDFVECRYLPYPIVISVMSWNTDWPIDNSIRMAVVVDSGMVEYRVPTVVVASFVVMIDRSATRHNW